MDDYSMDILRDAGFLNPDGSKNAGKAAEQLKPYMKSKHDIAKVTNDALEKVGGPISILASAGLGLPEETDAILAWVSNITTTSIQGALQKALTNGSPAYVLGSGHISRIATITQEDGTIIRRRTPLTVRYVTKNPLVVKQLMLDPLREKQDRRGKRDRAWLAMIEQRQQSLTKFISGELLPNLQEDYGHGLGLLEAGDDK